MATYVLKMYHYFGAQNRRKINVDEYGTFQIWLFAYGTTTHNPIFYSDMVQTKIQPHPSHKT